MVIKNGLSMNANPPAEIRLHKKSSTLELVFANDIEYQLSAEYLRVHSPSAEVRGTVRDRKFCRLESAK